MKLIIRKGQISQSPENFLRNASYGYIIDRHSGNDSFVRRLTRDHYPRLHMYVNTEGEKVIFNLHLDQKKTSYKGANRHNAEYGGSVVADEIERLKKMILGGGGGGVADFEEKNEAEASIGSGTYDRDLNKSASMQKKSWWKRLFS